MFFKDCPLYNITIEDEDDRMLLISLVSEPAVETNFLKFNKDKLLFSTNKEQKVITGVALLADVPIYRREGDFEFYVVFTKDTIKKIVEKYSKEKRFNLTSLEHSGKVIDSCTLLEVYFVDKERNICPKEFSNVTDGSLIVSYKVNDDKLWEEIKNTNEFQGFSIELNCNLTPTNEGQEIHDIIETFEKSEDYLTKLLNWLSDEKKNFKIDKSSLVSAIEKRRAILIDEGGSTAVRYYPHSIGKDKGKDCVVLYSPTSGKWSVKDLSSIKDMIVTKDEIGELDYTDPTYEEIMSDEDIKITRTSYTPTYSDLIHNKIMCQISYNDEKEEPALGYRQVAVIAYGYTKKSNEAIRIMEIFGDSRSVREGEGFIPDYRLLLTKRIKSLKPMKNTAPWGLDILDSRVNFEGDRSFFPCIDHISLADFE